MTVHSQHTAAVNRNNIMDSEGLNMSSIKDVAELAGVSLSTASIVVNGKSRERKISEKTQQRVMEAMQTLNYIPNVSAKILRKGESQKYIVALFWNFDFRGIMMHRFLFGLQKRIQQENANMSIVIHPYQTGELSKEEISFISGEFHAAIIGNADGSDLEFLKRGNFQVPIILYNRILEDYCSVNVDDEKIGIMAADHLYAKGYRRPAVIRGRKNFPGATHREEAFLARMEEHGAVLPENKIIYADNSMKGGYECGEKMLQEGLAGDADSLFCSSDSIALGIIHAWAGKKNVPDEVGLIAIGNSDPQYTMYNNPSVSVINIPIEEMASGCFDFLSDGMYQQSREANRKYFDTRLLERMSTDKNGNITVL